MRKPSAQAALAKPLPRYRAPVAKTLRSPIPPPALQRGRRSREAAELVLLIHAGWVGMALLLVACLPAWKADFDKRMQPAVKGAPTLKQPVVEASRNHPFQTRQTLFAGGSDSLVARTVGHAEGTRTPDGRKTRAYYGHKDPGNGAWNLGSFSFQHCREARYNCSTPEAADDRQLQRLQSQHAVLLRRAAVAKLQMTLAEQLNGIDLANQAPLAALSDQGYIDRLSQAKQKGFNGQDAILEARVWSYWSPQKKRWDAPGLGNIETSIRHDQERRLLAIARAMAMVQQQVAGLQDSQRALNLLKLQPEIVNPYAFSHQRSDYLWWDAGYWDAKLQQQRQVPPGYDPAYDRGFANGSTF
ncbi:hypothetical protein [Stenomitos frigidus]|uniref:hypothetical protein n=1 Tax=Stenomitos frigidus TaxID=1886765 RepID=UPI0011B1D206|nr:hypothetical protein [Stenomitos frigidus]